jgi:hypothetical protein
MSIRNKKIENKENEDKLQGILDRGKKLKEMINNNIYQEHPESKQ